MKKALFLFVLALVLTTTSSYGQQDPQYTHYMYNMNVVNPAYAGSRETLSVGVLYRAQWFQIQGAPRTISSIVHSPIGSNLGVGLSMIADEVGPVKEQNIYADVSYTINTSDTGKLAFGLKGGVTLFNAKISDLLLSDGTRGVDELFANDGKGTFPNLGAGIYYHTDKFYAGLSVPSFLETKHFKDADNTNVDMVASEKLHAFLTLGYVMSLSDDIDFKPSIMIKGAPEGSMSGEIAANVLFNGNFELGLGYRLEDSINGLVSFLVSDDLKMGYSYDYTLSNLGNYSEGTHELFLQYDINMTRKNLKSPRFF